MIRVLVADDQALIRSAVRELVGRAPDMEVVGEAVDGVDAVAMTRQLLPDVVLMDVRMPQLDGIAATARICDEPALASVRVLVLTTFEEDAYVLQALRAGASGFIGKGAEHAEILAAVRTIHAGEALLSPRATRGLIDRYLADVPESQGGAHRTAPGVAGIADLAELTPREVEVLTLVGRGLSNTEIADELAISPHTAKTHVSRVMTKQWARDRAQLVIAAYEHGLVVPGV